MHESIPNYNKTIIFGQRPPTNLNQPKTTCKSKLVSFHEYLPYLITQEDYFRKTRGKRGRPNNLELTRGRYLFTIGATLSMTFAVLHDMFLVHLLFCPLLPTKFHFAPYSAGTRFKHALICSSTYATMGQI